MPSSEIASKIERAGKTELHEVWHANASAHYCSLPPRPLLSDPSKLQNRCNARNPLQRGSKRARMQSMMIFMFEIVQLRSLLHSEILSKKNRFPKPTRLESSIMPRKLSKSVIDRAVSWLPKTLRNGEPYLVLCQRISHAALIGARKLRKYYHKAPTRNADSGSSRQD